MSEQGHWELLGHRVEIIAVHGQHAEVQFVSNRARLVTPRDWLIWTEPPRTTRVG